MHRLHTIPRFSVDYGISDFLCALGHLTSQELPSPDLLDVVANRPAFWTSSGRQALWLILKALDLKPGSGVALPMYGDRGITEAVQRSGYKPVFVDVEEATLTMDPASLQRVRHDISAVVVLHFFGHLADMDALKEVAGTLPIIEDTVHAPYSLYHGRMAGQFGVACFYSFASTKAWAAGGAALQS